MFFVFFDVSLFDGVVRCLFAVAGFVLVDGFGGESNRWFLHFMPGVHDEQYLPALRHAQFLAFVQQVANLVQSYHHVPVPTFFTSWVDLPQWMAPRHHFRRTSSSWGMGSRGSHKNGTPKKIGHQPGKIKKFSSPHVERASLQYTT